MTEEREDEAIDTDDAADAAEHDSGQEQEPKQAEEDSSTLWDTEQHSDAPGPFGTGSSATPGPKGEDDEAEDGDED